MEEFHRRPRGSADSVAANSGSTVTFSRSQESIDLDLNVVPSEGTTPEPLPSLVSEGDVDDGSSLYATNSAPLLDDSQQPHQMPHASRRVQSAIPSGNKRRLLGRKVNAVHPILTDEELKAQTHAAHGMESKAWEGLPQDVSSETSLLETSGRGTPFLSRGKRQVTPAPEEFSMPDTSRTESPVAWAESPEPTGPSGSRPASQTSLQKLRGRGTPLFGKHRAQVAPASGDSDMEDGETGRKIPDLSIFTAEGSLASIITVEEATGEKVIELHPEIMITLRSPSANSASDSKGSGVSLHTASQELTMPQLPEIEHHAYIPLTFAHEALAKVVNDMHRMKEDHVHIVGQIEGAYKGIEEQSQVQFRSFVQHLKQQHGSKVAIYKQVIKLLQEELDKVKEYSEGTTKSLVNHNRDLLEENRTLYRQMKDTFVQMEADKQETVNRLARRLEKERKKRTTDVQKAHTILETMQTKYLEDMRLAQHNAAMSLEQERFSYQQAVDELQRRLTESEKQMLESKPVIMETKLAVSVEDGEATKSSDEMQPQVEQKEPLHEQKTSTAATEFKAPLRENIQVAQRELQSMQGQLQAMLVLFSSESSLHDALETTLNELLEDAEALRIEKEALEQHVEEWSLNYREIHDGQEPMESEWDDSVVKAKSRLSDLDAAFSALEEKLSTLQLIQQAQLPLTPTRRPRFRQTTTQVLTSHKAPTSEPATPSLVSTVTLQEEKVESSTPTLMPQDSEYMEEPWSGKPELPETEQSVEYHEERPRPDAVSISEEPGNQLDIQEQQPPQPEAERELAEDKKTMQEEAGVDVTAPDLEKQAEGLSQKAQEAVGSREVYVPKVAESGTSKPVPPLEEKAFAKSRPPTKQTAPQVSSEKQQTDAKSQQELKKVREQIAELKKKQQADITRIKTLEKELKTTSDSTEDKKELKKRDKELKDLAKHHDIAKRNLEKAQTRIKEVDEELAALKKEKDKLLEETKKTSEELQKLAVVAQEGVEAAKRVQALEAEMKKQRAELKNLTDNYNSERVLRKKYYNMIEDMKGKIRVYCRARPLSQSERARNNYSVLESPDEFTMVVRAPRGSKEFQFDQVFTEEHSQERVFEDTNNLIQSAMDGYNVCIFAYGQTGSGKTYTMIGGKDSHNTITAPGVAPRAFKTVFEIISTNRSKFSFSVSCYMLELYNDRLIDLFQSNRKEPPKLDIKKDKKGLVYIPGSVTHPAKSAEALMKLFEMGSKNRHVASTKMNAESSRSHLVIGIVIESTNLTNGAVHRGKLSLVDLAGSERASKTGATTEQLKEAQSINKSLSALGDVISALSSGQDFIPYRNNKLTMLMQDSLGGNAKTLMFVNISPADYNTEETVISLTYAARVKLITNDASKNADNKEISRLKGIIAKLRRGEALEDEEA